MPLPTPHKGEPKDKFVMRCMHSEEVKNEYDKVKQRVAVCMTQWTEHHNATYKNNASS